MGSDIKQLDSLYQLFLQLVGEVYLAPYSTPEFNELTGAQKKILFLLVVNGPQRMSEIARQVSVSMAAATGIVDKLVASDLVSRENAPDDRRVVIVSLTSEGRRVVKRLNYIHERRLKELLDLLPEEQRSELISLFERIIELLGQMKDAHLTRKQDPPEHV